MFTCLKAKFKRWNNIRKAEKSISKIADNFTTSSDPLFTLMHQHYLAFMKLKDRNQFDHLRLEILQETLPVLISTLQSEIKHLADTTAFITNIDLVWGVNLERKIKWNDKLNKQKDFLNQRLGEVKWFLENLEEAAKSQVLRESVT